MTIAESRFTDSVPRSLLAIARELRIANKLKVFELNRKYAVNVPNWKDIHDELEKIMKEAE
jgi:hypothetical protein